MWCKVQFGGKNPKTHKGKILDLRSSAQTCTLVSPSGISSTFYQGTESSLLGGFGGQQQPKKKIKSNKAPGCLTFCCSPRWLAEGCWISRGATRCHYMERWPSLWQDQGITLNPPDRCHMHARAHKCTGKRKWWQREEEEEEKKEGDINLKKKQTNTLQRLLHAKLGVAPVLYRQPNANSLSCKLSHDARGEAPLSPTESWYPCVRVSTAAHWSHSIRSRGSRLIPHYVAPLSMRSNVNTHHASVSF